MFYTLASKIPFIQSDKSKRKILKIFIIGSVLYILLHYYLHSVPASGVIDTIKQYLYYIMPADFVLSYFLLGKTDVNEGSDGDDVNESNPEGGYSQKQLKEIQAIQSQREYEYQQEMQRRHMLMVQQKEREDDRALFKKKEVVINNEKKSSSDKERSPKKEEKKEDRKEETKENKKEDKKEEKKKERRSEEEGTDTCIPVYMGK
jgi:hypothetical protein